MATQTINYTDKVFLNENSSIADINKIKDVDMNEIKSVVNNNASETDTNTTNITNLRGTELYNNADGSTGNIPLSDSASNYICFDIITSRGGNGYGVSRVYSDYMTNYTMINSFYSSDVLRFYASNITISGTTITRNYSRYANFPSSGANSGAESDFRIHKVVGYK